MTFLLDVNVLIALLDPAHVHHQPAHAWFAGEGSRGFATCPLTENAVLRIFGNPRYPKSPGSPAGVMPVLRSLVSLPNHEFWPDDVSLLDTARIDAAGLTNWAHLTDVYLLALAARREGRLATFDRRLQSAPVTGGRQALLVIA